MKFLSKAYFKQLWKVLLASFTGFSKDNGLKLSASLAYYTVFSIAPLLIIVISVAGLVFGQDAATERLYPEIVRYVGKTPAAQIQDALKHLALSGKSGIAVVIGVVTLLLGASSIFIEIQDSLNIIWRVKAKPKSGWMQLLKNRFVSFSLIISLGFLLLASLIINLVISALKDQIQHFFPGIDSFTKVFVQVLNLGITLVVITTLFGIIFKFLPDVKIKWRDVRSGAVFTAILFMIGQYLISLYIQYTAQGSAYGAAGSIIVILVWIYYTSAILYIGAEFTQVFAEASGSHIEPADYAVHVQQTEVEHRVKTLPPQNPQLEGHLKKDEGEKRG
ncbi:YihY/virulence factor BrkB family protein [Mucilaginibacter rubeus]|uniref:YihY/virulence factor BrkB family protein n=1 Tax=Mucilaginibacter rubeus TaxID=2027860 RepID=A0AAE6JLE4_9SPHI|nr:MULTISPECIES: YihY/virulence factor BrkB family protein [Mucilaginibacter]QEM06930.1 YihY/virulence factor BrkB family protein [Mucilaginibacter rubeus]QEM19518.1 YihY/virulence factor BrkB family protein [Mucilaginibacter gossypii]QTE43932.1 YihY/virulence factor BrkB family protein [Mucilaginibacter rubeus]QTE50533.1 YihY/virulence factor BrkB family protein [Mucilaginibacter rubeus]QTE55618.1 YihY/virulence factor BrkB family protein [Mucilaginibacter rubeus]